MKITAVRLAAAGVSLVVLTSLAVAGDYPLSGPDGAKNWGHAVKEANQNNGYPGGTNRGAYVRQQARDGEGPGYSYENQTYGAGAVYNSRSGRTNGRSNGNK